MTGCLSLSPSLSRIPSLPWRGLCGARFQRLAPTNRDPPCLSPPKTDTYRTFGRLAPVATSTRVRQTTATPCVAVEVNNLRLPLHPSPTTLRVYAECGQPALPGAGAAAAGVAASAVSAAPWGVRAFRTALARLTMPCWPSQPLFVREGAVPNHLSPRAQVVFVSRIAVRRSTRLLKPLPKGPPAPRLRRHSDATWSRR